VIAISGIVRVDFQRTRTNDWRWDTMVLHFSLQEAFRLAYAQQLRELRREDYDRWPRVENWPPFATINAIYDAGTATYTGFAVDAFRFEILATPIARSCSLMEVVARYTDAFLTRIGYKRNSRRSF
jgi:hypothetical protein